MSGIKITCDSTCDLTESLYSNYGVTVMPLGVVLGEDLRKDGVDVDPAAIFDYVGKTGVLPKTSAVSVNEYYETFKQFCLEGSAVIHINISSDFSSCYTNAVQAASMVKEEIPDADIRVIDSRNLSSGSGHLVLLARELANSGLSATDIEDRLNKAKNRLDVSLCCRPLNICKRVEDAPALLRSARIF